LDVIGRGGFGYDFGPDSPEGAAISAPGKPTSRGTRVSLDLSLQLSSESRREL
jgi:hypothetical protein